MPGWLRWEGTCVILRGHCFHGLNARNANILGRRGGSMYCKMCTEKAPNIKKGQSLYTSSCDSAVHYIYNSTLPHSSWIHLSWIILPPSC
jgi:hypothetical protein